MVLAAISKLESTGGLIGAATAVAILGVLMFYTLRSWRRSGNPFMPVPRSPGVTPLASFSTPPGDTVTMDSSALPAVPKAVKDQRADVLRRKLAEAVAERDQLRVAVSERNRELKETASRAGSTERLLVELSEELSLRNPPDPVIRLLAAVDFGLSLGDLRARLEKEGQATNLDQRIQDLLHVGDIVRTQGVDSTSPGAVFEWSGPRQSEVFE